MKQSSPKQLKLDLFDENEANLLDFNIYIRKECHSFMRASVSQISDGDFNSVLSSNPD